MVFIAAALALSVVGSQAQSQNILNKDDHLKALALKQRANVISADIIRFGQQIPKRDDCLAVINDLMEDFGKDLISAAHLIQISYQMETKSDERLVNERLGVNILDVWQPNITAYRDALTDAMPTCSAHSYFTTKEREITALVNDDETFLSEVIERIGYPR
jgi:hypothetical protein